VGYWFFGRALGTWALDGERFMADSREEAGMGIAQKNVNHFPTPYGCLTQMVIVIGALAALVFSATAVAAVWK